MIGARSALGTGAAVGAACAACCAPPLLAALGLAALAGIVAGIAVAVAAVVLGVGAIAWRRRRSVEPEAPAWAPVALGRHGAGPGAR